MWRGQLYILGMVTLRTDTCDKCKNSYRVEPEQAWKAVVLDRY
jgi:hypothetical protein